MKKSIIRSLRIVYDSSHILFILSILSTIISGCLAGISIYSLQKLINSIQIALKSSGDIRHALIEFLMINIGIVIINQIESFSMQKIINNTNYYLDNEFIIKCSKLPLKDFENEKVYDSICRANELGKNKIINIYFSILQFVNSIISILAVSTIVLHINKVLLFIVVVIPILSTIINIRIGKYAYNIEKSNIEHSRQKNYINYLLTNNLAIKEIICFNASKYLTDKFKYHSKVLKSASEKVINKYTIYNLSLSILKIFVNMIIISTIIAQIINNQGLIGNIMGFINSINLVEARIQAVLSVITSFYKDKLYVDNYFDFIDKKVDNSNGNLIINNTIDRIYIKNLEFAYTDDMQILKKINLSINKEHPIAIIGVNGSGKTTLIKILASLYDNYTGDIFINQYNLRDINISEYRKKIAVIFQDFNKYELSLRENIAFSDLDSINNDIKIIKSLKFVGLSEIIRKFMYGIDTQMGKWFGGEELSKGQWQRVALARAFFKDADIIIMDEPTSFLDPIIEREIFEIIKNLSKDKILILVTHRIENLEILDPWCVLMENGEIKEQGLLDNIQKNELFKKLANKNAL